MSKSLESKISISENEADKKKMNENSANRKELNEADKKKMNENSANRKELNSS